MIKYACDNLKGNIAMFNFEKAFDMLCNIQLCTNTFLFGGNGGQIGYVGFQRGCHVIEPDGQVSDLIIGVIFLIFTFLI